MTESFTRLKKNFNTASMVLAKVEIDAESVVIGDGVDISTMPMEIDVMLEAEYRGYKNPNSSDVRTVKVTADDIEAALAHFKARKEKYPTRDLVVDYEHQTWSGDQAPAAGWIEDLHTIMRDGKKVLRAKIKMWTQRAVEYIKNKEYRYISPVFAMNAIDKETGKKERCILFNAALTNEQLFDGLLPIVSSHKPLREESTMNKVIAKLTILFQLAQDATEDQVLAALEKFLTSTTQVVAAKQKVAGILGLKPEATLDEIEAGVVAAKAVTAFRADLVSTLGLDVNASNEAIKAAIVTAKAGAGELVTLSAKVKTLEEGDFNRRFDGVIAKSLHEGRILPSQMNKETEIGKQWLDAQRAFATKDIAAFETFWAKQPVIGPVGQLPAGGQGTKGSGLSEDDRMIAKQLKVDEATLLKYNPAVN